VPGLADMNKKRFVVAWIVGLCLLFSSSAFAQYLDNEDLFFSYKRFYAQLDILNTISGNRDVRKDIKDFMRNFSEGIYAISAGDPVKAKPKLLKALAIWPEYFGTDFLLARVNEDTGDYDLSARFYKSYLNKLKAFSEGRYRISGPIMRGITPYRIENYDDAYTLVRDRLEARGIDLAAVRPFSTVPSFLRSFTIFVMLVAIYAIMAYMVIPYIKRRQRISNPPKGSWVCKKCETYNNNILKECEKCGEKR
jgi:tetratricopeptide (TPR) repeat protein